MTVMIDNNATHNFIAQMKIKELNFKRIVNVPSDLIQLNETSLQIYEAFF